MTRVGYVLAALAVVALHDARADVAPRHLLRWTRGPGADACVDAPALTAAVEARLGYRAFGDSDAAVIIEAHVQAMAPGWHVAIAVRHDDGTLIGMRELDEPSADCRVLDEALVLMIALIVDPDAAMRTPPPKGPPVAPIAPPPPPPILHPSPPWLFEGSAAITAAGFLLPGASVGAAARVSIDPPGRLPAIVIRGTWWLEDELRDRKQGSSLNLVTGGVGVRVPVPASGDLISIAGGIELGRMAADGFGFDLSQHASALVAYLTLEPTISVKLRPWLELSAMLGAWVPLVRPRFVYDQGGETVLLYQPSPVAFVGHVGLAVPF